MINSTYAIDNMIVEIKFIKNNSENIVFFLFVSLRIFEISLTPYAGNPKSANVTKYDVIF